MKGLTRFATLSLFTTLLVGAGCHDNDKPIEGRGDIYKRPWLMLGSDDLRKDLVVGDAVPVRDASSGILFLNVPVRNVTDKQLYIDYRVIFSEASGMQVNEVKGTTTIPARQSATITANSTSNRADKFQVEMSYPRLN